MLTDLVGDETVGDEATVDYWTSMRVDDIGESYTSYGYSRQRCTTIEVRWMPHDRGASVDVNLDTGMTFEEN